MDSGSAICARRSGGLVIEPLTTHGHLEWCLELQRNIWGMGETDLVPVSQLHASIQAGGLVLGALDAGQPVGFAYALPAYRPSLREGPGLHSDMAGVLGPYRSKGVGRALKWFQRSWALERGFEWIQWSFDPLRAANARFNLEYLGAKAKEYLIDAYGPMADGLNAGLPSDRLIAHWELRDEEVSSLATQGERARPDVRAARSVMSEEPAGKPIPLLDAEDLLLHIPIPGSLDELKARGDELALHWRIALQEVLTHYLSRGYVATRFVGGGYLLERSALKASG